jgi:hypothetical protein
MLRVFSNIEHQRFPLPVSAAHTADWYRQRRAVFLAVTITSFFWAILIWVIALN